ncbi:hypothetical protein QAD02_000110, partial [Eretmocerus hayati]
AVFVPEPVVDVVPAINGHGGGGGGSGTNLVEEKKEVLGNGAVSPRHVDEKIQPNTWLQETDEQLVSPAEVGRMLNLGNALADGPRTQHANKYLSLVSLHLPVILRLSVNCPFRNVRTKCSEIIQMVKDRGLPVPEPAFEGPSAFVPVAELPDLNNLDEK